MEKEKSTKPKNKLLKYLPRAASAVSFSFQNPPFSPGRDHHHQQHRTHHANKGFSGPILIPDEARRKPKNEGYQVEEPTSPKVSCIGQIKKKKNKIMILKSSSKKNNTYDTDNTREVKDTNKNSIKGFSSSRIRRIFGRMPSSVKASGVGSSGDRGVKNDDDLKSTNVVPKVAAPSLGQMKRFASGRETLGNFDWSAQIAPVEYCSDDERKGISGDGDGEEEEEEEVIIPYSAPILMGGGGGVQKPLMNKKEVNLWRRRTMDRPVPLKLK